jgi:hypothetical protein
MLKENSLKKKITEMYDIIKIISYFKINFNSFTNNVEKLKHRINNCIKIWSYHLKHKENNNKNHWFKKMLKNMKEKDTKMNLTDLNKDTM